MRIALIIERFAPGGGAEAVAWRVAHALSVAGDDVTVLARRAHPSAAVRWIPVRVPTRWQPLRVWSFALGVRGALRRLRADVVHSFSRTTSQHIYRAGGGCHATYLESAYGPRGRRLRQLSPRHRSLLGLERRIYTDPRQWIQCNSRMVREQLLRRYAIDPERAVVIYNGVDLERFHPRRRHEEGAQLRARRGAGDKAIWLFVGSGWRRKGLDTALTAVAQSRVRNSELWVAGDDPPRAWWGRAAALGIRDRVVALGPRSDLEAVYAAADALVLPTRYDAFANVCLEAAAAGLPVVTSAANGVAELLDGAGFVSAEPGDAAAVAAALDQLADPDLRRTLGARARRMAESHTWSNHLAALRRLYGQARAEGPRTQQAWAVRPGRAARRAQRSRAKSPSPRKASRYPPPSCRRTSEEA